MERVLALPRRSQCPDFNQLGQTVDSNPGRDIGTGTGTGKGTGKGTSKGTGKGTGKGTCKGTGRGIGKIKVEEQSKKRL